MTRSPWTDRAWLFVVLATGAIAVGNGLGVALRPAWPVWLAGFGLAGLTFAIRTRQTWPWAVVLAAATFALALASLRTAAAAATVPAGPLVASVVVERVDHAGAGQRRAIATIEGAAGSTARVGLVVPALQPVEAGWRLAVAGSLRTESRLDDPSWVGVIFYPRIEVLEAHRAADPWLGLRTLVAERLRGALPQPEASLAGGLLIGRTEFAPEAREQLVRAGLSHIVAVSGFNVSVVGGFVTLVFIRILGRRGAVLAGMGAVLLFALVVGDQPSAWRAATMWWLVSAAWLLGRRGFAVTGLACAVLIMLAWEPWLIFDVSFQLSVAGTIGLVAVGLTWLEPDWAEAASGRSIVRLTGEALLTVLAATAATQPLVAFHFGTVSLVTPLANLLVTPLVPPAMLLAVLTAVAPVAPLAALAQVPLGAILLIGELASALPLADVPLNPGLWQLAAAYLAIAVAWFLAARAWRRLPVARALAAVDFGLRTAPPLRLTAGVLAFAILATLGARASPGQHTGIWVLDVGQGDATLLIGTGGGRVLIDAAPDERVLLAGLDRVLPASDRRIDAVILTHLQQDHVGGLPALLKRGGVRLVASHGLAETTAAGRTLQQTAAEVGVPWRTLERGDVVHLDSRSRLWVVSSPGAAVEKENDRSLVLLAEIDGWRILIAGDVEQPGIRHLLATGDDLRSHVLRVPHHGSRQGLDAALLSAVAPRAAVISAGRGNRFGHPAPEILALLEPVPILRTDRDGTIWLQPKGDELVAVTSRRQ